MQHTPEDHNKKHHAVYLSSEDAPQALVRVGLDSYAVIDNSTHDVFIAFKYVPFSEMLNSLNSDIVQVNYLVLGTPPNPGDDATPASSFEVRLGLQNSSIAMMTSAGECYVMTPFAKDALNWEPNWQPATDAFPKLPKIEPYIKMQLEAELIAELKPCFKKYSHKQVLSRLWLDFENESDGYSDATADSFFKVFGEFLDCYVVRHRCGRVTFLSSQKREK